MATVFVTRELYGGAIAVKLPADFIDASNLRQIPDHQEVYLSPTSLTSIIFEINEYQTTSAHDVHSNIRRRRPSSAIDQPEQQPQHNSSPTSPKPNATEEKQLQTAEDEGASIHHFLDPISPPDSVDPDSITRKPPRIKLSQASVSTFPAYTQSGMIISPEQRAGSRIARRGSSFNNFTTTNISNNNNNNNSDTEPTTTNQQPQRTKQTQLLIRMKKYETDLCIRITVPLKEYQSSSSSSFTVREYGEEEEEFDQDEKKHAAKRELNLCDEMLDRVRETLDIVDFGLFVI